VGAISGYKLDFELIRLTAEAHPEWSILLIGKVGEGDPRTNSERLRSLENVHFLGPRPYQELPAYLKGFDVAILPSALNDYTQGMFPMKFFEYLAAGRPVVSTNIPALRAFSHVARLARDDREFISAIEDSLQGRCADLQLRLSVAQEQTYERRTESMMRLISETVQGCPELGYRR
jgi:glycosyltransferase involved in cell wall biosynthesis